MKYYSGEEIRKGDKVLIMDTEGEIEFIVEEPIGEPAMDWYLEEIGPGVMVIEPKVWGRVFLQDTENAEDLILCQGAAEHKRRLSS